MDGFGRADYTVRALQCHVQEPEGDPRSGVAKRSRADVSASGERTSVPPYGTAANLLRR